MGRSKAGINHEKEKSGGFLFVLLYVKEKLRSWRGILDGGIGVLFVCFYHGTFYSMFVH